MWYIFLVDNFGGSVNDGASSRSRFHISFCNYKSLSVFSGGSGSERSGHATKFKRGSHFQELEVLREDIHENTLRQRV